MNHYQMREALSQVYEFDFQLVSRFNFRTVGGKNRIVGPDTDVISEDEFDSMLESSGFYSCGKTKKEVRKMFLDELNTIWFMSSEERMRHIGYIHYLTMLISPDRCYGVNSSDED